MDETGAAHLQVPYDGCHQLQEHYERLRHLALEDDGAEVAVSDRLELAFIEQQGLAAWAEACLAGSLPVVFQEGEMREPVSSADGLVLALVELIVGCRQEVKDG